MIPARRATALAVALAADSLFGEPPETLHPTVLMGRTISWYEGLALSHGSSEETSRRLRFAGLVIAAALPALTFAAARAVERLFPWRWLAAVVLMWTAVSMRGLAKGALAVERELRNSDLEAARKRVGEIVGRDTAYLSETEVARAAVESVAENTSDGVVAPMLCGLLFGAPGALAYKAINTLDSMIGHPDPPYTDLGRASARLDDLANLAPARLTALAAAAASGHFTRAWSAARKYGPLTRSPNAGWAEAAFAGALGLTLGGPNSYAGVSRQSPTLGNGRPPAAEDIRRAVSLMQRSCLLLAALPFVPRVAVICARGIRRSVRSG